MTPQQEGRLFEERLAEELGLKKTPGSGAFWSDKLDLKGTKMRWSLKYTSKRSFSISQDLIDEAVRVCEGPGGDFSIPLWAIEIESPKYDMVLMRKDDFLALLSEDQKLEIKSKQSKYKNAKTPTLLREDG